MDCPKCIGRLEEETLTVRRAEGLTELRGAGISYELKIDKCFSCGGLWFDKGELDRYLTDDIKALSASSVGGVFDREADRKVGKCPRCGIPMRKVPSSIVPDVTTDACDKCGGIWLDPTEIDRLERASEKHKLSFFELFLKGFQRPKDSITGESE